MDKEQLTNINNMKPPIDHFTDAAAIYHFIRFKEYYGMTSGQKENIVVYFLGKMRSLLHLNTAQRSFFPITIVF